MRSHDSTKPRQLDSSPRRRSITLALPRRLLAGLLALGFGAMIFGLVEIGVEPVSTASAGCQNPPMCGMINTQTAILEVDHQTTGGDPVLPDDSEVWLIEAFYSTTNFANPPCICNTQLIDTAVVTVTYSSGWTATCSGCTGPINSVAICEHGQGCDNIAGELGYKLIVDIDHTAADMCDTQWDGFLSDVTFTTTSVDDGDTVSESDCSIGSAVSPTSQTWSSIDSGAFECSGSCSDDGAFVTILYN